MDLRDRVFLVAGASGGLGSEIARALAAGGARLGLVSRDEGRLAALSVEGVRVVADLRLPGEVDAAVETVWSRHGRLDGVVNAVGVVAFGDLVDTSTDIVEELFLTNTFVPAFLLQASLRRLEPDGVFVSLSGIVAERPLPGMAAYSASKAGASALLAAAGREARRKGIRVLDARPGHTETGLADRPLAGTAPRFPAGHTPAAVASRIVDAIAAGEKDLPPAAFET